MKVRTNGGANVIDGICVPHLLLGGSERKVGEHVRRHERLEMRLEQRPRRLGLDTAKSPVSSTLYHDDLQNERTTP